jgi:hypothetical protein
MSLGKQVVTFEIKDSSGEPITDLKPYLGSFGHLVMVNQETYDYLHVHPYEIRSLSPDENGGPKVSFLPIGLYGPIKSGVYRTYGQFNHNGQLFVADFTLEVN